MILLGLISEYKGGWELADDLNAGICKTGV